VKATIDPETSGLLELTTSWCLTAHPSSDSGPIEAVESPWRSVNILATPSWPPAGGQTDVVMRFASMTCGGCFALWTPSTIEGMDFGISSVASQPARSDGGAEPGSPGAPGRLVVVGVGIRTPGQLTDEVRAELASATRLLYLSDSESALDEETFASEIRAVASGTASVDPFIRVKPSPHVSGAMAARVEEIIRLVKSGERVCLVTYGHPNVHNSPARELVLKANEGNIDARMLPAVSSLDCLFADLLVDPVAHGLQVFDALGFLTLKRAIDPSASLALLQPSLMTRPSRLLLAEKLAAAFPVDHVCYLYRASVSSDDPNPTIEPIEIDSLAGRAIKAGSILFIPATSLPETDEDLVRRFRHRRGGR
jgi:hypothetical protein